MKEVDLVSKTDLRLDSLLCLQARQKEKEKVFIQLLLFITRRAPERSATLRPVVKTNFKTALLCTDSRCVVMVSRPLAEWLEICLT